MWTQIHKLFFLHNISYIISNFQNKLLHCTMNYTLMRVAIYMRFWVQPKKHKQFPKNLPIIFVIEIREWNEYRLAYIKMMTIIEYVLQFEEMKNRKNLNWIWNVMKIRWRNKWTHFLSIHLELVNLWSWKSIRNRSSKRKKMRIIWYGAKWN